MVEIYSTELYQVHDFIQKSGITPNATLINSLYRVSNQTGVSVYDIVSDSRVRLYTYARHLWFYVLNIHYKYDKATISEMVKYDASTISRGIDNIHNWKSQYAYIDNDLQLVIKQLNIA